MKCRCVVALFTTVLLAAAVPLPAGAATKYKACALLTPAEVEAVLGAKVVRTLEDEGEFSNCNWMTASPTVAASLVVGRMPPGMPAPAAAASKEMEELKRKGGTVQVAVNTPDLWCARIVQPAGKDPLAMCQGAGKGFWLNLTVHSKTATGQQAKMLFDKAVARLR